ncbi:unnamed protein product [Bemisia tabaci]|uniref:AAA-ATPase-like domain-containing protein n=1 Tax=Bemisia tabaci TaxID=7038 RepID=A0A9P0F6A1_BEMTA|nr:unnamed protein product [Bemisia tabaci]
MSLSNSVELIVPSRRAAKGLLAVSSYDFVPSSSEFSEIRRSKAFVDKTFFLHEWLTQRPKQWYVTAPPGFGKSSLAKMAVQFLNASTEIINGRTKFHSWRETAAYRLFQGTEIFGMKKFFQEHFQNYAVIYIDLSPLGCTTEAFYKNKPIFDQDFHQRFKMVIKEMMSYYPSLLSHEDMNTAELMSFKKYLEEGMNDAVTPSKFWKSASFLKKLLRKCIKKPVIVIVDSYDALCKPCMIQDKAKAENIYLKIVRHPLKKRPSRLMFVTSIKIFQFLGLISVTEERGDLCVYRVSSRTDAELMNGYLCKSGSVQRFFGISPQNEMTMISAVRGLAPNNDSLQRFGEAVYNIVKVKAPDAEYQLKALLYVYSRKVATYHSDDFEIEAGITSLTGKLPHLNEDGTPGAKEKIDIILVQKNKGIGIILTSKFNEKCNFCIEKNDGTQIS